jgi:hypothetical protein
MKALIGALVLLVLGGGGYYVFVEMPSRPSDPVSPAEPSSAAESAPPAATGEVTAPAVPAAPDANKEQKRRALWTRLRPASERLVPDPDDVGPCPPPDVGGLTAKVVRRYRDPWNGFRVWIHEDGSFTYLHAGGGGGVDPKTGRQLEGGEMVTTGVPTKPLPIFPSELPGGTAGK